MKKIEFIPATFHQVELLVGEINEIPNLCTPNYPNFKQGFSKVEFNCPKQVTYYIDSVESEKFEETIKKTKFILPICLYSIISPRRSYKYYSLKRTIHIKKIGDTLWNSGIVEVIDVPKSDNVIPHPEEKNYQSMIDKEVEKAQKYPDSELDRLLWNGKALNFNLFDFVNIPIHSGKYQIYISENGLESNHIFVSVIIEGEDDVLWDKKI